MTEKTIVFQAFLLFDDHEYLPCGIHIPCDKNGEKGILQLNKNTGNINN